MTRRVFARARKLQFGSNFSQDCRDVLRPSSWISMIRWSNSLRRSRYQNPRQNRPLKAPSPRRQNLVRLGEAGAP
jgi:hypothetical protein